jgi:hypothetical protein
MSRSRKGKGIGIAGKYVRTPAIRKKISVSVTRFQKNHPEGFANKFFKSGWIETLCSAPKVWVRSSWEKRVIRILDQYEEAGIEHVTVEPLSIPYSYEGAQHLYTPDLLVEFTGSVCEIWEIKPRELLNDPKNIAKFEALQTFASKRGWNVRIVTLADIEKMERKTWEDPTLNCIVLD